MPLQSFNRKERLKSKKIIGRLFSEGQSFGQYPLRLIWLPLEYQEGNPPIKCSVSVAKKKFPKATHRNRIRRQIKEAYRLNKAQIYEVLEKDTVQYAFMILYVAKEAVAYEEIDKAMKKMLHRFLKKENFPRTSHNQN